MVEVHPWFLGQTPRRWCSDNQDGASGGLEAAVVCGSFLVPGPQSQNCSTGGWEPKVGPRGVAVRESPCQDSVLSGDLRVLGM